jgi:hypothetical protein
MARRKELVEGPARHSSRKAALATSRNRLPWRHRSKHRTFKQSPAEKAALAEKWSSRKLAYCEALTEAAETIYNEAVKLREKFGTHSIQYYMGELMQQSRLDKKKRNINSWNVFLRNEVKRINEGVFVWFA